MERRRRARRQGQFGRLSVPPDRGQGDDVEEDGAFEVMAVSGGVKYTDLPGGRRSGEDREIEVRIQRIQTKLIAGESDLGRVCKAA